MNNKRELKIEDIFIHGYNTILYSEDAKDLPDLVEVVDMDDLLHWYKIYIKDGHKSFMILHELNVPWKDVEILLKKGEKNE